ncbi:MAG: hypothetical protein AB1696_10240 [Planctomycetota bacterium]
MVLLGLLDWLFGQKAAPPSEDVDAAVGGLAPDQICARAQREIDAGRLDRAYRILQAGLATHPTSIELRSLFQQVETHRFKEQIASLNASIRSNPDPASYIALVDAHRAMGDHLAARQICSDGFEKYPDEPELALRMGQIWFEVYREGYISRNALNAIHSLNLCLQKDPKNRRAVELLIHIYGIVGARSRALKEFSRLLPSGEIHSIYDNIISSLGLAQEDLDLLLRDFERQRAAGRTTSPAAVEVAGAARPNEALVKGVIEGLVKSKGHLATAVVDTNGKIVQSEVSNNIDGKVIAEVVDTLSEVAKACCTRMDIGTFQEEHIQGPKGMTFLKSVGDITLFVMVDKSARAHEISGHLAKLAVGQ